MKISDLISRWLVDIGCRNVYGVTGGSVVHLLHSAEKNERLSVIYNHHEQASAFAAVASSRIFHDRPGVCMVTTGPGGTNAITGLASAWLDSIPTIFISGQARSNDAEALKSTRQSGSQHLDIVNVVKPLTNYCATARSEEHLLQILHTCREKLFWPRPGPVWIDIPLDLQWKISDSLDSWNFSQKQFSSKDIPDKSLSNISVDLRKSKKPLFVLGYGCRLSKRKDEIIEILQKKQIPYVLTWNTLDYSEYNDKQNLGLIGISGTREANLAVKYCDCLVAVGSHLSKMLTGDNIGQFAKSADSIHIVDIDLSESFRFNEDKRFHYHANDLSDLNLNFIDSVSVSKDWIDLYSKIKSLRDYGILEEVDKHIEKSSINQYRCYEIISNCMREDDCIVVDGGGNVLFSCLQNIKPKSDNRIVTGAGIGCMGSGLPEAIGACMASGKRTLCFIGDGSMQFNIQELQTIIENKLPILIVIFNNIGYLAIKNTTR